LTVICFESGFETVLKIVGIDVPPVTLSPVCVDNQDEIIEELLTYATETEGR
jgi:hypothetical protein